MQMTPPLTHKTQQQHKTHNNKQKKTPKTFSLSSSQYLVGLAFNNIYVSVMKVKEESEKVGLNLSIQKTKIVASGPITSWEIDGERVSDFILGGSKITADGDCRHEIKRCLLLGKKVMTNLGSIFKSRDKGQSSQGYGFSSSHVWM